jgi:hypothetical protein
MSFVVHRVSKSAARYTDAGGREKCGYCRFFVAPRACGKVIGPVSPQGWCKYFSRQVSQQGSTPISGPSGPPGMTLDLNFMTPGGLPAGVTFARASTATYTDASGVIQTAAANAPRWDYAGGVLKGLLIEEARTNLCLQSADFSAWSPVGAIAAAPVVTLNQVTAPDGTLTADRIVLPAVSGAGARSILYQQITTSGVNTFSVWLRGAVGGEQTFVSFAGGPAGQVRVTLTTAWQRFTLTTPSLSSSGWYFVLGTDMFDPGQSATPAGTIYAWGAQVEPGAFATSYIPTTSASATRALDLATTPTTGWLNATTGSMFVSFDIAAWPPSGANSNSCLFTLDNGAGNRSNTIDLFMFLNGGNYMLPAYTAFVSSANVGGFNGNNNPSGPGTIDKIVVSWAVGSLRMSENGQAVQTGTVSSLPTLSRLVLGHGYNGPDTLYGHLKQVGYWPRVLSDAEMQQVTT